MLLSRLESETIRYVTLRVLGNTDQSTRELSLKLVRAAEELRI